MDARHPLAALLEDAAEGRFPPADGTIRFLGSPPGPSDAVVAFSAHNVVAAGIDPAEALPRLDRTDPGAPMSVAFLSWLQARLGAEAGMIDLVMVAPNPRPGEDLPRLVPLDGADHPRLERARRFRTDVRPWSDPDGRAVVVLGDGLAGRREVAVEIDPAHRGRGLGRAVARAAAALEDGRPLFAQVTPGNVGSVRAFLAAGYRPICSEVLFLRPRG